MRKYTNEELKRILFEDIKPELYNMVNRIEENCYFYNDKTGLNFNVSLKMSYGEKYVEALEVVAYLDNRDSIYYLWKDEDAAWCVYTNNTLKESFIIKDSLTDLTNFITAIKSIEGNNAYNYCSILLKDIEDDIINIMPYYHCLNMSPSGNSKELVIVLDWGLFRSERLYIDTERAEIIYKKYGENIYSTDVPVEINENIRNFFIGGKFREYFDE